MIHHTKKNLQYLKHCYKRSRENHFIITLGFWLDNFNLHESSPVYLSCSCWELRYSTCTQRISDIPVFILILIQKTGFLFLWQENKDRVLYVPTGCAAPTGRLARLRGVRAAGWMGKMPAAGWVWTALGLWRGVMEVSVVGIGSVSLATKGGYWPSC